MRSGGWYRLISLLVVLFFLSPVDPLFLLAACVGMFLAVGGPSRGVKLAGAAVLLAAYASLAPWGGAAFLIVYVSTASIAAVYSSLRLRSMTETSQYLFAALAGSITAAGYLIVTGGADLAAFEEALTRDLITAAGEGTRTGFSGLMGEDAERLGRWLEQGARAFAYLAPGFIVLMTIASLFLTTTLLRGAGKMAERLPGETSLAAFRFEDHLVWALIGGLLLFSTPLPSPVRRLGANAALVMTILFIVRGIGIWVSAMAARFASPITRGVIVILIFLFIPPVTAGLAFLSGLVDIWIDLRMRE